MMTSHTITAVIAAIVGFGAVAVIAPGPSPIEINSLEYSDGRVTQDRTVRIQGDAKAFYAAWAAAVYDADTGLPVLECQGSGAWPYAEGQKVADMTLARWTGNSLCTKDVLPHKFYLEASWFWGDDQTSAKSAIYVKD